MRQYFAGQSYLSMDNTIAGKIDLKEYLKDGMKVSDAYINIGGWQSWNPGFEICPRKKQPSLHCHVIKSFHRYIEFPESLFVPSRNIVLGQFLVYFRWGDYYVVVASCGNIKNTLPPVQFVIDRSEQSVLIEIYDKGKYWTKNQLQAEIEVFTAESYFECKEKIRELYKNSQLEKYNTDFPQKLTGWESWYNHYAAIDEDIITKDIDELAKTENREKFRMDENFVFQIDDGWEQNLGDWDYDTQKFKGGMKSLTQKIDSSNMVPGLWIAPFIIDARSKTALEHPDWILKNMSQRKIAAGWNPLWGEHGNFYCLDLSMPEVIEHIDRFMEKIINEWGFRYIKLDFLYAGLIFGIFKNGGAAYEWYEKALSVLTKRQTNKDGKAVTYLGCGVPFEPSFRYLPLSRIGCDTREHWENKPAKIINMNGRNAAYLNLKDTYGHAMWDRTLFINDPDVIFYRTEKCTLTRDEKILIATSAAIFGSQIMFSDDPGELNSTDELNLIAEVNAILEKYRDEEFSIKTVSENIYEIKSRSGRYTGTINVGKEHFISISEN